VASYNVKAGQNGSTHPAVSQTLLIIENDDDCHQYELCLSIDS